MSDLDTANSALLFFTTTTLFAAVILGITVWHWKRGNPPVKIHRSITQDRVMTAMERAARTTDNPGFCTSCGIDVEGVEPDARHNKCDCCGAKAVFGAEEMLLELPE